MALNKEKSWFGKHSILTVFLIFFGIAIVWSIIKPSISDSTLSVNRDYSGSNNVAVSQKQKIVLNFTGNTDTITDPFHAEGLVFFKGRYSGDSNFIVHAIDESGNREYLFNGIGQYTGTKSATLDSGNYRLQIEVGTSYTGSSFSSKGNWNIEVTN